MSGLLNKNWSCIVAVLLAVPAESAEWPNRPVSVIVAYPAGGNTDTMARIGAERLSAKLGQPFVVENRGGAGGAIATTEVAKAKPDGDTLLFAAASQLLLTPLVQKVAYDPKDLIPITNVGTGAFVLAIKSSLPAKTLQEFLAYARANDGKLNYASGGAQSLSHLSGALFVARAGLNIAHIPYKGGPPAVADLLAGHVDFYFGNASEILPLASDGRVRLVAVSTPVRMAQIPDVPAVAEAFPGFALSSWNGFMAPAGTPRPVIDTIAAIIKGAVAEPATQKRLNSLGIIPGGLTPEECAALFEMERRPHIDAIKAAGF